VTVLREAIRSWHRRPIRLREFYLAATLLPFMIVVIGWTLFLIYVLLDASHTSAFGRVMVLFMFPAFYSSYALPGYALSLLLLFPLSRRMRSRFELHLSLRDLAPRGDASRRTHVHRSGWKSVA
jgi:hypothetical protein